MTQGTELTYLPMVYKEFKALNARLSKLDSLKLKTLKDAPTVLNTNDRAMWVLGYNECIEDLKGK